MGTALSNLETEADEYEVIIDAVIREDVVGGFD